MGTDVQTPSNGATNRRRLLAFLGAGVVASLFSRDQARAGHDGTNILHLGEGNSAPPGRKTGVASDVNAFSFDFDNFNTGDTAGGLHGRSLGNLPAIQGVGHDPSFAGVFGVSGDAAGSIGRGSGTGVMGLSGSGPGVDGGSESGTGVNGHSDTGTGGEFTSNSGYALMVHGPAHVGANWNNFALGVGNPSTEDGAGGLYVTARGGKPALEADNLGEGVALQGVSWCCDDFGQGPGTGVQGISGSGNGVEGRSDTGFGGYFTTNTGNGVSGVSQQGAGVEGISAGDPNTEGPDGSVGVRGVSVLPSEAEPEGHGTGTGVRGVSGTGSGVLGICRDVGIAVDARAENAAGLALKASGRSAFSTAGSASVAGGSDSVFVANPAVTAESHIMVTLCGDAGGSLVAWLDRNPGVGFTVHLSAASKKKGAVPLTYLIVEPA